jgi:signal transduction histidine kinase
MGGLDGPLAGSAPHVQPLRWIANRARELTDAEQAIVLVPTDPELLTDDIDALVVSTAVGSRAAQVIGQQVPVVGSTIGDVFRRCTPVITDTFRHAIKGFTDVGERPALVTPLRVGDTVLGVIAIARNPRQPRFDTSHLDLVSDFAGRAAMALTAALAHACEHELAVLADRERIAHDLHDHVIDRLFAAGMDLQATIARCGSPEDMERLTRTVDDLQSTIDDIRTTVFRMQFPAKHASDLRQRIQTAVGGLTADRDDITTTMRFVGPMSVVGVELADHVEAVITEAVTNAVRHSRASRLMIEVAIGDELAVDIVDNGCGILADNQRLATTMHRRAQQIGGSCRITAPPRGGTHVRWTAPLI